MEDLEIIFEEPKYEVYIKVDSNNTVVRVDSGWNIADLTDWIKIDEGVGDKYHHAQSGYLDKGLFDEQGRFNYKYVDNVLTELTEEEKETLFPASEPAPTTEEQIAALKAENELLTGCVMELSMMIDELKGV